MSSSPAGLLLPALIGAAARDANFAGLYADEARRCHQRVLAVLAVLERARGRDELPLNRDPIEHVINKGLPAH